MAGRGSFSKLFVVGVVFVLALMALPPSSGAQGSKKPLSKADIVRLLKGDVSPNRVTAMARERGIDFQVTSETEAELRCEGATDDLVSTFRELAPKPLEPTPAQIDVQTSTNAEVYLDDQVAGRTGPEGHLLISNLKAGVHRLRVSLAGKKTYEQQVTVVAGQVAKVEAALADLADSIRLQTSPGKVVRFRVQHVQYRHLRRWGRGWMNVGDGLVQFRSDNGKDSFDLELSEIEQVEAGKLGWINIRLKDGHQYNFMPLDLYNADAAVVLAAIRQAMGRN